MSLTQFTEFLKKVTTANQDPARSATGENVEFAKSFSELKGVHGEEKVQAVITKLAAFAKGKGFDVSEADVKSYLDSLKTQYDLNPMVASMMDTYCSTTCHLGSAVGTEAKS
jgi:hypothetical protein